MTLFPMESLAKILEQNQHFVFSNSCYNFLIAEFEVYNIMEIKSYKY